MNILVIKQTSLGDVLHASGHIRAIKKHYPNSRLFLLTAVTSADIYRHNPWVDELIFIDRYEIKKNWYKKPIWAIKEIYEVWTHIRKHKFDLAIDLQGLAKTVLFLYGARATKKFVKGNWWGLTGFRNKNLHAIKEMDQLLVLAGIPANETAMEIVTGADEKRSINRLLRKINIENNPILIVSPFSRWRSKDWPLKNYLEVCGAISDSYQVVFTGSPDRKGEIDQAISQHPSAVNVAGMLSLLEFTELASRASLILAGDSFPMHVAGAVHTPVIALFGPTDESKVGPLGDQARVIRVPGCDICDKQNCPRYCLSRLDSMQVVQKIREIPRAVQNSA